MSEVLVGVDLGGTNVRAAVISLDKQVLSKESRPTRADGGPEVVLDNMRDAVDSVLKQAGLTRKDVRVAGIGMPGPLNWQTGIVFETPNMPGWDNVPVAQAMTDRLGITCYLDNDANVACYGEFWSGAGQGTECMALLTLGTGVGGGIVVFGQLLRGIDGTAAEVGHLKVVRDGRICGCGAKGCLEAYASVTGMVRTAVEGIEAGRDTTLTKLCQGNLDTLTGKMISDAAQQGDAFAEEVITETGVWLGMAISDLINLLNPEKVVLYGGMTAAGDILFRPVRETAKKLAFDVPAARCAIVAAELGSDAGVIGSAAAALQRWETERK